jgi:hypothetical protein
LYPSDLKSLVRPATTIPRAQSSFTRVAVSQSSPKQKSSSLKRSLSDVEIQKFAEGDDELDYSGLFDGFNTMSEKSGESEDADGDSLLLNTRLSNEDWIGERASDEEDPFAEIDEGFDEMGILLFYVRN